MGKEKKKVEKMSKAKMLEFLVNEKGMLNHLMSCLQTKKEKLKKILDQEKPEKVTVGLLNRFVDEPGEYLEQLS